MATEQEKAHCPAMPGTSVYVPRDHACRHAKAASLLFSPHVLEVAVDARGLGEKTAVGLEAAGVIVKRVYPRGCSVPAR